MMPPSNPGEIPTNPVLPKTAALSSGQPPDHTPSFAFGFLVPRQTIYTATTLDRLEKPWPKRTINVLKSINTDPKVTIKITSQCVF